jgi:hypothetical protein
MDFLNILDDTDKNIDVSDNDENINENVVNQQLKWEDRYIEIIKLMGLNENINYPINIIITGIIELYTNSNTKNLQKYHRGIHFRLDEVSKKIYNNLFGTTHICPVSHINIARTLKRLHRHYKFNNYTSYLIDIKYNDICKNNTILGFNYENLRWSSLDSYNIE